MKFLRFGSIIAAVVFALPSAGMAQTKIDEVMSYDGLKKVTIQGVELAYVQPGAKLMGYGKLLLDPVDVTFRKDWKPTAPGSQFPIRASDMEQIRQRTAKLAQSSFVKEFQEGNYQIVAQPGADVLRLKISIVDLYVNAPDVDAAGRTSSYTTSGGQATLVGELFDSTTGAVIARVIDRKASRDYGRMMLTNRTTNTADAKLIFNGWARILRANLDKARKSTGP